MRSNSKIFVIIAILIFAAILAYYGLEYYRYIQSPQYQAERLLKQIEEDQKNDPYAGSTPEETLGLLIEALKKHDPHLASKYFVIEKQKEWDQTFSKLSEQKLDESYKFLQRAKLVRKDTDQAFFTIVDKDNIVVDQIIVIERYNKWKIEEL